MFSEKKHRSKRLLLLCFVILITIYLLSTSLSETVIFSKNFRIAYVVVNSKWNEDQHFAARINAIQNTWATRIRETDTIFYPMERNYIEKIGKQQENIIELPLDMVNYKILYMLGKLITETHLFDWVYIAADSSYVIPSNVEAFIAQLPNNNMVSSDNKNNTNVGFSSNFINSLNRSECYYLGFPLEIPVKGPYSYPHLDYLIFNSPSGIIMNRAAILVLMQKVKENECALQCKGCPEEVLIANCFRHGKILAKDTTDNEHLDRFNIFQPLSLSGESRNGYDYNFNNSEWLRLYTKWKDPYLSNRLPSVSSLNFHYVNEDEIRALDHLFYTVRPQLFFSDFGNDIALLDKIVKLDTKEVQKKFGGYIMKEDPIARDFLLTKLQIPTTNYDPIKPINQVHKKI